MQVLIIVFCGARFWQSCREKSLDISRQFVIKAPHSVPQQLRGKGTLKLELSFRTKKVVRLSPAFLGSIKWPSDFKVIIKGGCHDGGRNSKVVQ